MSNGLVSLSLKKGPYVFGPPKVPVAPVAAAAAAAQEVAIVPLPEIPVLKELLTRVYERILIKADIVTILPPEEYAAQYKKLLDTLKSITDGGRNKIVEIALALYLGKRAAKTKGGVSDTFIQNYSIDINVPGDGPAAAGAGPAAGNRQVNEALYAYYNALPNDSRIPTLIIRKLRNFYLIGINDRQGDDIIPSYHISVPLSPEEIGPFPTYNMHFTIEQVAPLRNLHEFHHFNDPRGPIKILGAAGPGPGPGPRVLGAAEEAPQVSISKGPTGRGFTQPRTRVAGNNVGVSQASVVRVAPVAPLSKWEARARGIRQGGKRRTTRKHRQRRKGKKSRKSRKTRQ
jgi:hypothetical protein